jgi:CheY-like chemotaxis protein/nitrogen-specific signal transduction histidine kinase
MARRKAKPSTRRTRKRPAARSRGSGARAAEFAVAALAHDIRTPLTGILALSELLAASDLGARERRWVASLKSNAEHLSALTTLVVDAARADARRLVVRRDPFDLPNLLRAAGASLAGRAESAGLSCTVDLPDNMPALVLGDATRLRAALENLFDNAVKFTERGGVAMKVMWHGRGKDIRLAAEITDSGIGLTAAEIRQLFQPFTQANAGTARRFGGAGLGLALVKRLAKALGGDLTVKSRRGRGSTFRLDIRMQRAEVAPAGSAPAPSPLRVLHVEDNPYGRLIVQTILTSFGHQVEFVATGEAAVEAVQRDAFDLVLMDVSLAGIDGLEATRRIRAIGGTAGGIPVIGLSGHGNDQAETAALAAGMDGYLIKPVTPRALADAIAIIRSSRPSQD